MSGGGFFNQFLGGRTRSTGQQGQGDGGTTNQNNTGGSGMFGEDSREYDFSEDGDEVPGGGTPNAPITITAIILTMRSMRHAGRQYFSLGKFHHNLMMASVLP